MNRRKTLLGLFVVVSLLFAFAATAQAGFDPRQYNGTVEKDSSTYFGFDVQKKNGKTRIEHFETYLAYTCRGGESSGSGFGEAKGSLLVKNGKFAGKLAFKNFSARGVGALEPGSYLKISGKAPKQGKARGHVDALIKFQTMRGSTAQTCYTGNLDWNVKQTPIKPGG